MTTLLLRNGRILDLDHDGALGDVTVSDGRIVAVSTDTSRRAAAPDHTRDDVTTVDLGGNILIPGLINAHTHSNQTLEKGLCDTLPLDAWMVIASYGGAGARLQPRDLYVSAMMGGLEMIRSGTTAVLDCARADLAWIDAGMDSIMQAYLDLGLRASVAIQVSDLDFFSSIPLDLVPSAAALRRPPAARPESVLAAAASFLDRWESVSDRVRPMLGPSSLPRCSDELFAATVDLARKRGVRLQTHLLSAASQINMARERFGGSTVSYLAEMGVLEDWASFAHAIWLNADEVAKFAETQAVAVHNPASNLKLGAGVAPIPALLRSGAVVAIGSDGASSNDTQNMFETLKLSTIIHRVQGPPANWPSADDGLRMCWRGGSRAVGIDAGRISPGAVADLTVLDADIVWPAPAAQLRQQLVYGELGSAVRSVYVDGSPLLRDGDITTVDEAALRAEAREIVARIWSTLPARLARFEEYRSVLEQLETAVGHPSVVCG